MYTFPNPLPFSLTGYISGQSYCGECLAWDELNPGVCIEYADCGQSNLCCEECCDTVDDVCCGTAGTCALNGLCVDPELTYYDYCALPVSLDPLTCATGDPVESWCKVYDTPVWVFNIADFVQYFWDALPNGKVLQVRFYKNEYRLNMQAWGRRGISPLPTV